MNQEVNSSSSAAACNNIIKALFIATGFFVSCHVQAQHQLRGVVIENDRYNGLPLPLHYGKAETLPPRISYKQYLPRIVTQVSYNTAATWSAVWYANTIRESIVKKLPADKDEHGALALSPAYTYRTVQDKENCHEAVSLIDVLTALQNIGAPRFTDYPEFCATALPHDLPRYKLPGFVRLFNTYDPQATKTHAIKKALKAGSPVVTGIICPPSFQFATEFWQPREEEALPSYGGHALCVFGYDDQKLGGAFEVANTWGTRWANGGTTWIRYDDFARHVLYGFQLLSPGLPLEASIRFTSADGMEMPVMKNGNSCYAFKKAYKTGDTFRVSVNTRSGIFCSAIALDAAGQSATLFPSDTLTNVFVGRTLFLPGEADSYTLTEPVGRNMLYFVFGESAALVKSAVDRIINNQGFREADPKLSRWAEAVVQFESEEQTVVVAVELNQR